MDNINLNYFKVFYYVVKNNSFVKAASELNLSQPNVSKTVKELEREINVKLIIRKTKKEWEISERGRKLYELLDNLFDDFKRFSIELKGENSLHSGKVRIGIKSHFAKFYLIDIIKIFIREYPQIKFDIVCKNTTTLIEYLKEDKIDFLIDTLPIDIKIKNDMIVKNTKKLHCIFVANQEKNDIKKLKDLEKEKMLFLPEDTTLLKELNRICNKNNIELKPILTSNSTEIIKQSAKDGIGIAYIFEEMVNQSIKKGNLYKLEIEEKLPSLDMNIVYKKDLLNNSAKKIIKMILNS